MATCFCHRVEDTSPLASILDHCSPVLNLQICPSDVPLDLSISNMVFLCSSFPSPDVYVPSLLGSLYSFFQHAHFIRIFTILPIRHSCMLSPSLRSSIFLPQIIHLPPSDHPSSSLRSSIFLPQIIHLPPSDHPSASS